jgi:Na+/H+ antiporter NhaD/arsenite permease-like protein
LLALPTASNIGSAATITGNPQNILIGSVAGIGYRNFLAHLGPVALFGLLIDWAVIHRAYLHNQAPDIAAPPSRIQAGITTASPEFHLLWPPMVTIGVGA